MIEQQYDVSVFLQQNGSVCLCSDVMAAGGEAPDLNCQVFCPGNEGERCGGKQAISIYSGTVYQCQLISLKYHTLRG